MPLHRVVALLNPPQSPFELACATEVFGTASQNEPPRYSFRICTERPGPLRTTAGYAMIVGAGLEALEQANTVVVPGWEPPGAPIPPAVTAALRSAHRRGARMAAICTGAFVLARLLCGRRSGRCARGVVPDFPTSAGGDHEVVAAGVWGRLYGRCARKAADRRGG